MGRRRGNTENTRYSEEHGKGEHYWKVLGAGEGVTWEQVGELLRARESIWVNPQEQECTTQPAGSPRLMEV